jgi:CheY-like chemotaxis protein
MKQKQSSVLDNSDINDNKANRGTAQRKGRKLKILLIEDNPADAHLMRQLLLKRSDVQFDVVWSTCLKEGLKKLEEENFDVILLDMKLPESSGLSTVKRTYKKAPGIPIIVLTALNDEEMALDALSAGAQDYLVKGHVDRPLIARAIRYAIERRQMLDRLEEAREKERHKRDLSFIQTLSAQSFGVTPIRLSAPGIYEECIQQYKVLLGQALEQQAYKVDYHLSEKLRKLAETIGFLEGGPRDVIEIYTQAVKEQINKAPRPSAQALMEEARIIVLELMGHLVSYYRKYVPDSRDHGK